MVQTAGRLQGKRVLITGTGRGQGAAAQELFCSLGASVIGCDALLDSAEAQAESLRSMGYDAKGLTVDLGDPETAAAWVQWAAGELGGVDVLYNNAGRPVFEPFAESTLDGWHSTIRHELDIVFYVTSVAWKFLIAAQGASVINTASTAALLGTGTLSQVAHSAAKGGVLALTRQLAAEGAKHGVRANAISPGFVRTPGTSMVPEEFVQLLLAQEHMDHRAVDPKDVALLAAYLASDESKSVTGANFPIDGGWSAGSALA